MFFPKKAIKTQLSFILIAYIPLNYYAKYKDKNHLSKKHICANIATNVMTALFDVHELGLHSLGKEFSFCVCIQSFITWRKNKRC